MKRFPVGLSALVAVLLVLLISLGLWQLRRLQETKANQAKIVALTGAAARPIAAVMAAGAADHVRVTAVCAPSVPAQPQFRYAIHEGAVAWRALTVCRLTGAGFDSIVLDRGVVGALTGAMAPRPMQIPGPQLITGVLRNLGARPSLGNTMDSGPGAPAAVRVVDADTVSGMARAANAKSPAPYVLAVEAEDPLAPGVFPSPLAEDLPRDNLGYALTWFGLAAGLFGIYVSMVLKKVIGP